MSSDSTRKDRPSVDTSDQVQRRSRGLVRRQWHWTRLTAAAAVACALASLSPTTHAQSGASANQTGPAQTTSASSDRKDSEELSEVVVTGSRVQTANQVSISPIDTLGNTELKELGSTDVEATLRDLPEAFPGKNATTNNGGNGDTTANLRNLGAARTLVVVDGKRFVGSSPNGQVDLDSIPPGLIDRIDVLTGGASAVYGSDAIAGVVNVILKKDFSGLQSDVQYGQFTEGDGRTEDASILAGVNSADGKGNVTVFAGYTNRAAVTRGERDWASPGLVSNGVTNVPTASGVIPQGRDLSRGLMFTDSGQLVPYDGTTYNTTVNQYTVVPQERSALGVLSHYELFPALDLYMRGNFSQNNVNRRTSVSQVDGVTEDVNYGNPLLSSQERSVLFGAGPHGPNDLASIELEQAYPILGNSGEHNTYNLYSFQVGGRGKFDDSHFEYDVSAQYGQTIWIQRLVGDMSPERFQEALLVNPDGTCTSGNPACVPLNVFNASPGSITNAQAAFISLSQGAITDTRQVDVVATVNGDLAQIGGTSPLAHSPITVALGSEYRRESSDYAPDDILANGDNLTFGAIQPEGGRFDVREVFTEIRAPLLEDQPFAKDLDLEGGFRHSDYSTAGETNTYKYGANWTPVSSLRFRGAFEHAVRAPDIDELYSPLDSNTTSGFVDPCYANNGQGPTASRTLCTETGVPAAAYGNANLQCPAGACRYFEGGNPHLGVETANSVTFGVSVTPAAAPAVLSLDYYDIKLTNAIAAFGFAPQLLLQDCYGTAAGENPAQDPNNVYCKAVQRGANGTLFGSGNGGILQTLANIGAIHERGVDLALRYAPRLADLGVQVIPGSVSVDTRGSFLQSYAVQAQAGSPFMECAGAFGLTCGQPINKWRFNTRVSWSPSVYQTYALRWRYMSGVILDQDVFTGTETDPPNHKIDGVSYVDLYGTWRLGNHLVARAGVTNLADRRPPTLGSDVANGANSGLSDTFPGTYDVGRFVFVGLSAEL